MSMPVDGAAPPATLPVTYDPTRTAAGTKAASGSNALFDSQMFLQLLVAQLKYQDPTNPTDTAAFMSQSATLSQVETMTSMSATLNEMFTAQQTASATAMIGKVVAFTDGSGTQFTGLVDSVYIQHGQPFLQVGDYAVPLAGVLGVADPVLLPADQTAPPADGDTGVPPTPPPADPVDPTDPPAPGPGETPQPDPGGG